MSKMDNIIEPKVRVVSYGPVCTLENEETITPDELVWGAAGITYKDIGALEELFELKRNEKDLSKEIEKSLVKSAGAGHASMATTPGFWLYLGGKCSKLVDSMFTGARFSSSLMPSGRRIPVAKEQILVPAGIALKNEKAKELYLNVSEANIDAYERLQKNGVPKEEAVKIVQYGHRGGGFMFMPLETFISFKREAEFGGHWLPAEGIRIIDEIESFVKEHGMGVTYEARRAAPRTGCPNPNIFHNRKNLAYSALDEVLEHSIILSEFCVQSYTRDKRINEYLESRDNVFSSPERIKESWPKLLRELEEIVADFNDSVGVVVATNTPWRVWGEVKRHRTLPQTAESIYHAVARAKELGNKEADLSYYMSLPESVRNSEDGFKLWRERFADSVNAYFKLLDMGVHESDAIALIPRGIKLSVVKNFDLYNLTTGYMSLRLCSTAEEEMRRLTEQERELIIKSPVIPRNIHKLLSPKCSYVGFCPDDRWKKCGNVLKFVPGYNAEVHADIQSSRKKGIEEKL